jgi:hypothetical protein
MFFVIFTAYLFLAAFLLFVALFGQMPVFAGTPIESVHMLLAGGWFGVLVYAPAHATPLLHELGHRYTGADTDGKSAGHEPYQGQYSVVNRCSRATWSDYISQMC